MIVPQNLYHTVSGDRFVTYIGVGNCDLRMDIQQTGQIVLLTPNGEKMLTGCGIYSDITNGGKTAKAVFTDDSTETAWSVVCADLTDRTHLSESIMEYAGRFPYAKTSDIDGYMAQTFGQTLQSVGRLKWWRSSSRQ